jgi:hypothetical protein
MAQRARDNRVSRRSLLLAGLGISVFRAQGTPGGSGALDVSFDGDNLHVAAPDLHFLTGKPLERLKNADTVTFLSQLTVYIDERGTILRRLPERLVVSYDLWEKRFAVTIPGGYKRSMSNLTAQQAEVWCIENLAVSALGLPPDRPFWLKFELRTTERRELSVLVGDSGISLTSLIDIFSHPAGGDLYWSREAGPLRLRELPRTHIGRGKNG